MAFVKELDSFVKQQMRAKPLAEELFNQADDLPENYDGELQPPPVDGFVFVVPHQAPVHVQGEKIA